MTQQLLPLEEAAHSDCPPLPTLTKAELIEQLSEQLGLHKNDAKEVVDGFFELMLECLATGEDLKISGLGNFQVRDKASRPGRNPRTGDLVPIAARRVVVFHASTKCKALLQQG
ncbi:MAG: integration host factor subunit alpha [Comamonas sp.]|nr:integration host factor subunit alpha [Comamonas sp.]